MNEVILYGNTTKDAKTFGNGNVSGLRFTLAVNQYIKKSGVEGWKKAYNREGSERVMYASIVGWNGQAGLANKLPKGTELIVECEIEGDTSDGVLRPHTWNSRDNGVVAEFQFRLKRLHFVQNGGTFLKVTALGRLGGDPEMKYTSNGVPFTKFSVATNEFIPIKEGRSCPEGWVEAYKDDKLIGYKLTTWLRCTAWNGIAEVANEYLAKGRPVFIIGKLGGVAKEGTQTPYVHPDSGKAQYDVTIKSLKLLGKKKNGNGGGSAANNAAWAADDNNEDPMPF